MNNKKKYIKVPTALISGDCATNSLKLDGGSIIESCIHNMGASGIMFLEQHILMMVLDGTATLSYGEQTHVVHKNEMILLKKATVVRYEKTGNPNNANVFDSIMFCLKDELLKEFLTLQNVSIPHTTKKIENTVNPMNECLIAFAYSLKPYFNNPASVNPGLLKLKVIEMLYDISDCNKNIFRQILLLRQPIQTDIRQVIEQHYASPINLSDLAYFSKRSLSSFKRDFQNIYNMPPAQWIRKHRLHKAKEMLQNTNLSITEICYLLGFKNSTHFSRIFKKQYGVSPSDILKKKLS